MGTATKHPVPDQVKPSFVIFDIRALWRSGLSVRVSGCQKMTNDVWLNPVWHRMVCSCTHMTAVGVKGLNFTCVCVLHCWVVLTHFHSVAIIPLWLSVSIWLMLSVYDGDAAIQRHRHKIHKWHSAGCQITVSLPGNLVSTWVRNTENIHLIMIPPNR